MAFTLPVFNLSLDIYTGPMATRVFRLSVMGNLAWGRRTGVQWSQGAIENNAYWVSGYMTLLLPPLTDVRSQGLYPVADVLEIPSGSGRWYGAQFVDDIGKGFPNEHRGVMLVQLFPGEPVGSPQWPMPMP
jgi:hypothetical protein